MPAAWSWELRESWPVGPAAGPQARSPACRAFIHDRMAVGLNTLTSGWRSRPEGPLALVPPLPHWSLPPTLCRPLLLLTTPHAPSPPTPHPITPSLRRASFGKRRPD